MSRCLSTYNTELKLRGFNVFQIEEDGNTTKVYSRKDFYKICLTTGKSRIHYADRSFDAEGTILFFGNPNIPYSWETLSTQYVGYTIFIADTTQLGVGHTILDYTGSISYVLELFSAIFGKFNLCTNF